MTKIRKVLIIAVSIIYFACQFIIHTTFHYTGIFIVALILLSLQTFSLKKILLLIAPIAIYPIIWSTIYLLPSNIQLQTLLISLLVFSISYAIIMKNVWSWLDPNIKRSFLISITLLSIFALFFANQAVRCLHISAAEKGVSISSINLCKSIGQFREYFSYTSKVGFLFLGKYFQNFMTVYFPLLISGFSLINSRQFQKKGLKKSANSN